MHHLRRPGPAVNSADNINGLREDGIIIRTGGFLQQRAHFIAPEDPEQDGRHELIKVREKGHQTEEELRKLHIAATDAREARYRYQDRQEL